MIGAYILIVLGVAVWAVLVPTGKRLSDGVMRGITVFGGAFLLGVCCLELLPELGDYVILHDAHCDHLHGLWPYMAIMAGFLLQQALDGLSSHVEHGHTEEGFTFGGLMLGLCLHAFLEGMPLVREFPGEYFVSLGLMWGIVIHNIPVALLLVGLMVARGMGFWRVLMWLLLFGVMSPLGSLFSLFVLQPDFDWQKILVGMVVGVLLHVSSSILFDHKRNHFSWLNIGLMALAFVAAGLITH